MFEELLNNTGYILRVLPISNFAEPFNFSFGPLVFLYVSSLLYPDAQRRKWPHFLLFAFWVLYMIPYFIQPEELKYNSYLDAKHPGWEFLEVNSRFDHDPLGIRGLINLFTGIHIFLYSVASLYLVAKKMKDLSERIWHLKDRRLKMARNVGFHFAIILMIFVFAKLYFGADLGDYLISTYLSFMIFLTSWSVVGNSTYFKQPHFFLQFPEVKYRKSSLTGQEKSAIHHKIVKQMEEHRYFTGKLASLSDLAQTIQESPHHVSQVINEVMEKGFFEMLAWYRVEEARKILSGDTGFRLTIEEVADRVGYNSKSSFNTVFKKHTGLTPSQFRKNASRN
jgi:AraC-like DNA-binding protein